MTNKKESPRKELLAAYEQGNLRNWIKGKLSDEATQLLIDIVGRRCSPRRKPRLV